MIIETIFSTLGPQGEANFAAMGVRWGEKEIIVYPFRNTHTYGYLTDSGYGVVNVTDNVLLLVQSALTEARLACFPAHRVPGVVLQAACYWRELAVIEEIDRPGKRAEIRCRVVNKGRQRDFLGFNRGQNAIIEAAIVATRLHLYSSQQVWAELERSREIVQKTGGTREQQAMEYLFDWVEGQLQ
jgi:hypothetical protein